MKKELIRPFKLSSIEKGENSIKAKLSLNNEDSIFKAHFPNDPLTPGVCQLNLIKLLLHETLNVNLLLESAKHIKFINAIRPKSAKVLEVDIHITIQKQRLDALVVIKEIEFVFFKANLKYKICE